MIIILVKSYIITTIKKIIIQIFVLNQKASINLSNLCINN